MKLEHVTDKLDIPLILDLATNGQELFPCEPTAGINDIVSGLSGVVSVFAKPVTAAAMEYKIDPKEIYFELGRLKAIAGQEDLIIEVAQRISRISEDQK
jgi:4-hydroxy 2-oxovalerate aldolase